MQTPGRSTDGRDGRSRSTARRAVIAATLSRVASTPPSMVPVRTCTGPCTCAASAIAPPAAPQSWPATTRFAGDNTTPAVIRTGDGKATLRSWLRYVHGGGACVKVARPCPGAAREQGLGVLRKHTRDTFMAWCDRDRCTAARSLIRSTYAKAHLALLPCSCACRNGCRKHVAFKPCRPIYTGSVTPGFFWFGLS